VSSSHVVDLSSVGTGVVVALVVAVVVAVLVAAVRHWLQSIRHELMPNSGTSMRDAVDRIEAAQVKATEAQEKAAQVAAEHTTRLAVLTERLDTHIRTVRATDTVAIATAAAVALAAHDERKANTREIVAGQ
jgi:hypothetical protein